MVLMSNGVLGFYKAFGQTFIRDDKFLSLVGSISSVFNCTGRFFWGTIMDKTAYKVHHALVTYDTIDPAGVHGHRGDPVGRTHVHLLPHLPGGGGVAWTKNSKLWVGGLLMVATGKWCVCTKRMFCQKFRIFEKKLAEGSACLV